MAERLIFKSRKQIRKVSRPAVAMRQDFNIYVLESTVSHVMKARAPSSTKSTPGYNRIAIFSIHPYANRFQNSHGIINNCDPSLFTGHINLLTDSLRLV